MHARWLGPCLSVLALVASVPAWGTGLQDLIPSIKPSIVAVGTYQPTRNPRFQFRGTGFVVGDGGLVATNRHVIPDSIDSAHLETLVVFPASTNPGGGAEHRDAKVVAADPEHDLVVLEIAGAPLRPLKLQAGGPGREGTSAAFTGFPLGGALGLVPVTHRALISAITPIAIPMGSSGQLDARLVRSLERTPFNVLQLDATAYPGNSGSPVYDEQSGEVLGILNMVFVKQSKDAAIGQPSGISFAIPIEHLRALLAKTPGHDSQAALKLVRVARSMAVRMRELVLHYRNSQTTGATHPRRTTASERRRGSRRSSRSCRSVATQRRCRRDDHLPSH